MMPRISSLLRKFESNEFKKSQFYLQTGVSFSSLHGASGEEMSPVPGSPEGLNDSGLFIKTKIRKGPHGPLFWFPTLKPVAKPLDPGWPQNELMF